MDDFGPKPRLRGLLEHFSQIEDPREAWRIAHPLPEVLLLAVCASVAFCDDFDWGENHLPFPRRFLPYHHGIPGAHRSGVVLGLLHELGERTSPGSALPYCPRWQDLALQP